jgi:pimeloyl-ACP methyl ester carboxylesterase
MPLTPVIYLHGFASSPGSKKARYFQERIPGLIVPDLAGGDFEHLTITGQLAVIERTANGRPVSLIGSSMGGYLAALYGARHPEVEKLVLMAPAFAFAKGWEARVGPEQVEEWRRTGFMEVFHYGDGSNHRLGYQLLDDARGYEDFPALSQPTLIFHGAQDDVVSVDLSRRFSAGRPNVRLEVMDSGHELLNVLDEIGAETLTFLDSSSQP